MEEAKGEVVSREGERGDDFPSLPQSGNSLSDLVPSHDLLPPLSDIQIRILAIWSESNARTSSEVLEEYKTRWPKECPAMSTIQRQIRDLRTRDRIFDQKNLRHQLLFELELLYQEAYQSWLDSKEDEVTIIDEVVETGGDEDTPGSFKHKTSEKRKPQTGEPAHWKNALSALKSIREMTGVDEPKRVETIIRHEVDLILQYLEITLTDATFEEVMRAFTQYNAERKSLNA